MRELNVGVLLKLLRERGPSSRPGLSRISGLSLPTVNARVRTLLEAGFVREVGTVESSGGRPARLVEFNANFGCVAGVDVGGGRIVITVVDLAGRVLGRDGWRLEGDPDGHDGEHVRMLVTRVLRGLLEAENTHGKLLSLGLATPGLVEPGTGEVSFVPNIPGWEEIRPVDAFAEDFWVPVTVDNDVNAAIIGERWRGAARGVKDALFVLTGRGVGAGVLIGGRVHRGFGGSAGEIGLQRPFEDDEPLGGLFGPLERKTSESGMVQRYRELGGGEPVSAGELLARAEAGDAAARTALTETASLLSGGLVNACAVLAPELVVLGGGAGRMGEWFISSARERLEKALPRPPGVVASELGDEASVTGAARLALDDVERRVFAFGRQGEGLREAQ